MTRNNRPAGVSEEAFKRQCRKSARKHASLTAKLVSAFRPLQQDAYTTWSNTQDEEPSDD